MRRLVPICALAAVMAVPAWAPADPGPTAVAARKCSLTYTQQRSLGTTYVLTLRVDGTTCANGRKVVKAYHLCRRANGGRDGRCPTRVYGYRCVERRLNRISSQYDARVRCTKTGREIFHVYTQNT